MLQGSNQPNYVEFWCTRPATLRTCGYYHPPLTSVQPGDLVKCSTYTTLPSVLLTLWFVVPRGCGFWCPVDVVSGATPDFQV